MRIIEYAIVRDADLPDLVEIVRERIAKGWQPQGGVASSEVGFVQAMVKYAPAAEQPMYGNIDHLRPTFEPKERATP